jgi:hypothetical protein
MAEPQDHVRALVGIRSILATTPTRVSTLFESVPDDLLRSRPEPNEWSALECLLHLHSTEVFAFSVRLRAFLAGEKEIVGYDPQTEDHENIPAVSALAAAIATRRADSLVLFDTVTQNDMARTARHEEFGEVTLGHLLHEWAVHDLNHLIQMERAVMQPLLPGVGPWRFYFADHDVEARNRLVE